MSDPRAADPVRPKYHTPTLFVVTIIAVAAVGGGVAKAEDRWYLAGAATGSDLNEPHQTIANAPVPGSTLHVTNGVDFGWGGQIAVGRTLGGLRLEAEVGHTENKSKSYTATSPISITLPQKGDNDATRYMANAYYDFRPASLPLGVYVGGGLGAADVRVTTFAAPARAPAAPPTQLMDFRQTVFAYQLMAGLSHSLSQHLAFTAQYRWFDAGTITGRDSRGQRATRDIAGHNLDVGLRYAF
jgi:opacity protein-like surface antigen